jgi:Tol biopolymer transport system component
LIVFQGNQGSYGDSWSLFLMNYATAEIERLPLGDEEAVMPGWGGDGRIVYYARREAEGHNLYAYDLNTRQSVRLTDTPGRDDSYPVWTDH